MPANHTDVVHRVDGRLGGRAEPMRVIDLYSGVGGWTLGLRMAGFQVVRSYEWWAQANRTYETNFASAPLEADIRSLPLDAFPKDVDVIVGSPPCTQFSFANRGGNGDIADGLKDIHKFLEVVEYVRPKHWVMENVPRVAGILERELSIGGSLERFSDLVEVITVEDMSEFGLPQRRRRMIAGSFPFGGLEKYRGRVQPPTLGQVISNLGSDPVVDPIYGLELEPAQLRDHVAETALDEEEVRLNRDAKQYHHYCNIMTFPDPLDRPARTVTALCTRVSRESIVVEPERGQLRRLTLRERATLQGFPITFQFDGDSYSDKLKQVGNAIPPLFVYYVAQSIRGRSADDLPEATDIPYRHPLPAELPPEIEPKPPRGHYPETRRFRTVIPGLRFGSGVRFDFANEFEGDEVSWRVTFFYGTSKHIHRITPQPTFLERVAGWSSSAAVLEQLTEGARRIEEEFGDLTAERLQEVWSRRKHGVHPHRFADRLGELADELHDQIPSADRGRIEETTLGWLRSQRPESRTYLNNSSKMRKIASRVFVGLLVGAWLNSGAALTIEEPELASAG